MPQEVRNDRVSVIRLEASGAVEEYLASTSGTRRIANDPLVLGDVVATGTSLRHALGVTIERIAQQGAALRRIVLFTFGGERATDVLAEADGRCRRSSSNPSTGIPPSRSSGAPSTTQGAVPCFGSADLVALCERRLAAIKNLVDPP